MLPKLLYNFGSMDKVKVSISSVPNCPMGWHFACIVFIYLYIYIYWNGWLCFIQIRITIATLFWSLAPWRASLSPFPFSFISYFLVYLNRNKPFWAPRQSPVIKHNTRSMTLKRSNIPYECISDRMNNRNEEIHFCSQWPHVFSLQTQSEKTENKVWERKGCISVLAHCSANCSCILTTWSSNCRPVS